jgi:transcriptional regulator GlxA family with amidase domain
MRVGILIFEDVEVLDFAGPFEVFSRTRMKPGVDSRRAGGAVPFDVFCVARLKIPVLATGGLQIVPNYGFADCPAIDLLVVPGGWGTRTLLDNEETLAWIQKIAATGARITSVCTGSLLLAKAGLLKHKEATTHWGALETLAALDPTIHVSKKRYVDQGIITSAGVSAGIDMALYVVGQLLGSEISRDTARYMDYRSIA